ncbi:RNA polymerase sigma factor [Desulfosarcina cetonica]|uniref:RNA polymerase sigma factor n=1 Tax=Desulfosarcina cetonica TaxID=90730 RepID=UPI0009FB148C|nr:sigma-70 family RNA polymerase sigma factor [Desulfosarcina cetonica]
MMFRPRHQRPSDAALVARVADGDERAFGALLRRHQDAVYGFAWRLLKDPQEAEDVTQETFLSLFQIAGRYRPEAALRTFLLRIAKNRCIDRYRKKRPDLMDEFPDIPSAETPLGLLEHAIDADRLEKAIDGLPVNQRSAILLRHTQQLSYRQIAEVMELSASAVESLLVRARRKLREVLREDD